MDETFLLFSHRHITIIINNLLLMIFWNLLFRLLWIKLFMHEWNSMNLNRWYFDENRNISIEMSEMKNKCISISKHKNERFSFSVFILILNSIVSVSTRLLIANFDWNCIQRNAIYHSKQKAKCKTENIVNIFKQTFSNFNKKKKTEQREKSIRTEMPSIKWHSIAYKHTSFEFIFFLFLFEL